MTVEYGEWRIAPYRLYGKRCWQVMPRKTKRGIRFYDNLGDALRFTAEYDLRNRVEGAGDIADAIREYERIAERIEKAVCGLPVHADDGANAKHD